jgi:hypothetical protein
VEDSVADSADYSDDAIGVRTDDYGMAVDHSATASVRPGEDRDVFRNNLTGHGHTCKTSARAGVSRASRHPTGRSAPRQSVRDKKGACKNS